MENYVDKNSGLISHLSYFAERNILDLLKATDILNKHKLKLSQIRKPPAHLM